MNALIWYKAEAIISYMQNFNGHPLTKTENDIQAVIKFLETQDPETLNLWQPLASEILRIEEFIVY